MRRYPHAPLSLSTCPPLRKGAGKWGREHMDGNVDDPGSPRVAATSESSEPGEAVQFPIECDRRAKRGRLAFGQQETIRGVDLHGLAVFLGEMMAARMGGEGGRQTATPSRSQDDWTPWFGIDEATPAADYASARE